MCCSDVRLGIKHIVFIAEKEHLSPWKTHHTLPSPALSCHAHCTLSRPTRPPRCQPPRPATPITLAATPTALCPAQHTHCHTHSPSGLLLQSGLHLERRWSPHTETPSCVWDCEAAVSSVAGPLPPSESPQPTGTLVLAAGSQTRGTLPAPWLSVGPELPFSPAQGGAEPQGLPPHPTLVG